MGKDRFEDLDFIDFNDSRQQESTVIADMLSAVYRNRKWFILSVVVCVLIGFLYLKSSPKIFLAYCHRTGEGRAERRVCQRCGGLSGFVLSGRQHGR